MRRSRRVRFLDSTAVPVHGSAIVRDRAASISPRSSARFRSYRRRSRHKNTDSAALADTSVDAIVAHELDFILDFSGARLVGRICTAAHLGLWTFSHLEDQRRGLSPGFREVAQGEKVSVCALQRRDDNGEATVDLRRGVFETASSWPRNADTLRLGSAAWCADVCREIALLGRPRGSHPARQPPLPAEALSDAALIAYLRRRLRGVARKIWRRLFFIETWNVALIEAPVDAVVRAGRAEPATWLPPPPALRFVADPFVLIEDGRRHLLFEEFGYGSGKGWISRVDLTGDAAPRTTPLFVRPSHMSYPFLFEKDDRIFCVPETGEDNRVLLFEAARFPDRWHEPVVLIDGFRALDSTVFEHDGRWWLLCTDATRGPERELHAWYSDALTGPFLPHPLNPLTCDVRSARPAGAPFRLDGVLHRPAQDCSSGYGGALTINRIDVLDPMNFSETPVARLTPDPHGPYPDGLHTISGAGDVTVIDGKRFAFHPLALALRLNVRLQAKRRRAALGPQTGRTARHAQHRHPLRPSAAGHQAMMGGPP